MESKQPPVEGEGLVMSPLGDSKREKKVIFMKRHSRTSSESSCSGDERQADPILPTKVETTENAPCSSRVSGRCLCKLSIVLYLLGCVLISTLYVIFYGNKQPIFGEEAWVPGKPTVQPPPKPQYKFMDLPYTEWISQRWTYSADAPFSDWPSLPPTIQTIQQVTSGTMDNRNGVWLLTNSELIFVDNLGSHDSTQVKFYNVTEELGIEVEMGNRVITMTSGRLLLITTEVVYLLDCSRTTEENGCEIVGSTKETLPFISVTSGAFSLSTDSLWLGTSDGLFEAIIDLNSNIIIQNATVVFDEVLAVAWRSNIVPNRDSSSNAPFVFDTESSSSQEKGYISSSVDSHLMNVLTGKAEWYIRSNHNYRSHRNIQFGLLVVGTREKLYFFDGVQWWFEWISVWESGLGGIIDGPPTSIAVTSTGAIYISNNVSVSRINADYTFDRIGPLQGLPYNQVLSLHFADYAVLCPKPVLQVGHESDENDACNSKSSPSLGTIWIGTKKGYSLYDVRTSSFKGYFYGPRWHSGEAILGITSAGDDIVVLHTDKGLTVVWPEQWTLAKKAGHYQNMLARHTRPPGLVADCPLTNLTPSTCSPYTTDNDGLWTSLLVAAESFRYQVTKDPLAKYSAWSLFKGMQFLVNVTGVRGLMARSVVDENVTVDGEAWHDSSSEPGWRWKGDTSSDEVVGHMFAYPLIYDLVARDSVAMKDEVVNLVDDIIGYIHNNSFELIDTTNQSTRWGVWSPGQLNVNQSWSNEHGLNSLQILSHLLSAYRITGKNVYIKAFTELFGNSYMYDEEVPTHYGLNMINQKITVPWGDNYSDDELSFLPYFVYFNAIKHLTAKRLDRIDSQIIKYATVSLERSWRVVAPEKSSLWTVIYAYAMDKAGDTELIEKLVWSLRSWPLELIIWRTNNSHRLDIRTNPEQDRHFGGDAQSVNILPAFERTQLRWSINPYQLDTAQENSEMDPGAWLLPYWLARWIEML